MSRIILAPMEGLADNILRDCLTQIGGIDLCVTEFIRVTTQLLPPKVFHRLCPELANGCKTPAGIPVRIQLLGSDPEALAANAVRALELGSPGIDLNFGCPAKTVNRSQGGAVLLQEPKRVAHIIATVRHAIGDDAWLSAKMRLGFATKDLALENAQRIQGAGANELTVHARTKVEGYRPPAHWQWIKKIRQVVEIPVIANGEVWTPQDYAACRKASGSEDVMVGRGLVWKPDLALQIRHQRAGQPVQEWSWPALVPTVLYFIDLVDAQVAVKFQDARVKQWLKLLGRVYPQANACFEQGKRLKTLNELRSLVIHSQ
ncbi:tRNA-dihydrouridine synthase [Oceanospirillaceae bacterium]|uniref:tRNA dihydrouridine synthase n=1 Tax=Candidatus Njordibacter sp. Uisw_002 TaxID=3230971 RepID=UPI002A3F92AE|nr:tRNA-dihydrouridine synthase [Oceanospirillaceae bacterium]